MDSQYEQDEDSWREEMVQLLNEGKLNEIDTINLKVVLTEMSKSDYRAVVSAFRELIAHLLKADYQPKKATRSWFESINKQRVNLENILTDSPSLINKAKKNIDDIYVQAVRRAVSDTGRLSEFPDKLPYTFEQLLDDDFIPKSLFRYRS